jgi:hypothetical protein
VLARQGLLLEPPVPVLQGLLWGPPEPALQE